MKYNLIYFNSDQMEDYMFNKDYRNAYNEIIRETVNNKINKGIWTGRINKDGRLPIYTIFGIIYINKEEVNKVWVRAKDYDYSLDFKAFNSETVRNICDNKFDTYKILKNFMPETSITPVLIFGEKVVCKPVSGYKGQGVQILKRGNDLLKVYIDNLDNKDYIFQEFLECSDYEPLNIKGVHDIRAILVKGEVVGILVRTPKDGELICNLAKGGTGRFYDTKNLKYDYNLEEFINSVHNTLPDDFNEAVYSIDFCNTKDGFKVIELNHFPGIRPEYKSYINTMIKIMK